MCKKFLKKEMKGKERVPPVEHSAVVFAISCSCVQRGDSSEKNRGKQDCNQCVNMSYAEHSS